MARTGGYGIATAGREVCVYRGGKPGSTSWPASAEIERLGQDASAIADALAAQPAA